MMTCEQIRAQLRRMLTLAAFAARWTPGSLDNSIVAALQHVVDDDELFTSLCALFGLANQQIVAGVSPRTAAITETVSASV